MADHIKVNTTRLQKDSEKVNKYVSNMEKEISKMKDSVSQLDKMWDGESSTAFKKAFNDDMNAMATIIKNLKGVYSYESNAKKKYESCETKVASLISEIRV
ncbi:MAG: WXG100 family type VII secretion target [Lachnospiraceae bacterium]